MMISQLRPLAIFAHVADAGSFQAAAIRLGMSASVVSYHVTSLEKYLDTPLIYRTTRRLSLTDAGQKLAISARAMLREAEGGFGQLGQQSTNPTGSLRIIAPAILQYSRFVTRASTYIKHHPNVDISMSFTDLDNELVADGFDLGFRLGPLADSSLISRKLVDGQMTLCAAQSYLNQAGEILSPADLSGLELLGTTVAADPIALQSAAAGHPIATVKMTRRIRVDSGFAARRMAEEGAGVVLLPDFSVRESMKAGHLVEILPDWQAPAYGIHALWPPNIGTNHLRDTFLKFIAQIAKAGPERDRFMV